MRSHANFIHLISKVNSETLEFNSYQIESKRNEPYRIENV